MDQPPLIHVPLQCLHVQRPIPIVHDLFRHRLPDARPRHLQNPLPPVQQPEIVPDVEIPRLEDETQLMGVATEDLLEASVREPGVLVLAVGGQ